MAIGQQVWTSVSAETIFEHIAAELDIVNGMGGEAAEHEQINRDKKTHLMSVNDFE